MCVCVHVIMDKLKSLEELQISSVHLDVFYTSEFIVFKHHVSKQTGSWQVPDWLWLCSLVPDWFCWARSSVAALSQQPVGPHRSFSLHLNVSSNLQLEAAEFLQNLTGRL